MNQKLVDAIALINETEKKLGVMGVNVSPHCCTGRMELTLNIDGKVEEEVSIEWDDDTHQFRATK